MIWDFHLKPLLEIHLHADNYTWQANGGYQFWVEKKGNLIKPPAKPSKMFYCWNVINNTINDQINYVAQSQSLEDTLYFKLFIQLTYQNEDFYVTKICNTYDSIVATCNNNVQFCLSFKKIKLFQFIICTYIIGWFFSLARSVSCNTLWSQWCPYCVCVCGMCVGLYHHAQR